MSPSPSPSAPRAQPPPSLRSPPARASGQAWQALLSALAPPNAAAIARLASIPSAPADTLDRLTHKAQAAVAVFLYEQPYRVAGGGVPETGSSGLGSAAAATSVPVPVDWFPPGSRPDLAPSSSSPSTDGVALGGGDGHGQQPGQGNGDDGPRLLHAIMTTRALHLRSHPGQASLPGGKRDAGDASIEHTALRESVEEIRMGGWEVLGEEVHWLHTASPLLSKTCLLVHPVIFFLSNPARTLPKLEASPDEVSALWSVPLPLFLASVQSSSTSAAAGTGPSAEAEVTVPAGYVLSDPTKVDTHRPPQHALRTYSDVPWLLGSPYRLHRFCSTQQLIKGLTADILISLASTAYARAPRFAARAEGQMEWGQMVEVVLERLGRGLRGESRWGDGESGDAQGSTEAYPTLVGVDLDEAASGPSEEEEATARPVEEEEGGAVRELAASVQEQEA